MRGTAICTVLQSARLFGITESAGRSLLSFAATHLLRTFWVFESVSIALSDATLCGDASIFIALSLVCWNSQRLPKTARPYSEIIFHTVRLYFGSLATIAAKFVNVVSSALAIDKIYLLKYSTNSF